MIPTSQPKATTHSPTYRHQLFPWCIIRPLPNLKRYIVARFRRRNNAESHLQVLRRLMPTVPFEIVFDVTPDDLDG
ncbi:MAG: hypothetical protein ICV63_03435 [Coleofasciculus sp. Co-bin14]|nr:hypothetical protein [Coleofasciculus sp. Co-bin14]